MGKIIASFIDILDMLQGIINEQEQRVRELERELEQAKSRKKPGRPPGRQLEIEDADDAE